MTPSHGPGGERGASIVEFAVLTPVFVLIVMGILDLARGYQLQIQLENAAREGAAYAQLHPDDVLCPASATDITDRVITEDGVDAARDFQVKVFAEDENGDLTSELTDCGNAGADGSERVLVEVSATFDVMTPLVARVAGGTIDIVGSAEIELQR